MEATSERSDLARAMAKAIAYRDCGKQELAEMWAAKLVRLLAAGSILNARGVALGYASRPEGSR